ncbi:MAG: amino acid ABC transporter permease [Acidimicrobiales bacterium]
MSTEGRGGVTGAAAPRPNDAVEPQAQRASRTGGLVGALFNIRVLRVLAQIAFVAALAVFLLYLRDNYVANARQQGIRTSLSYLRRPTGIDITDSSFDPANPIWKAMLVGVQNTALAAIVGIGLASIVGLVVGVLRLSRNWVVQKAATLYVETLRNVPVLLVIVFTYAGMLTLPRIREAPEPLGLFVISNRWLAVPSPVAEDGLTIWLVLLATTLAAAIGVGVWRTRVSTLTGVPHHRVAYGGSIVVAGAVIGWLAFRPMRFSTPGVQDFIIEGGFRMNVAYAALTLALGLYTASHVAEIVRGSVLAVPRGQTEASTAVGLSEFQRLRYVILPQALRIAIPPTINQFLSLTKNTSLGLAATYTEVFALSTTIVASGSPALPAVVVLMVIYLSLSLFSSLVLNVFNRRFQLVER